MWFFFENLPDKKIENFTNFTLLEFNLAYLPVHNQKDEF